MQQLAKSKYLSKLLLTKYSSFSVAFTSFRKNNKIYLFLKHLISNWWGIEIFTYSKTKSEPTKFIFSKKNISEDLF